MKEIRKIINELGLRGRRGKMLSVSNYQYILHNPLYYGLIRYNVEFYEGEHEPIISKKLFDECKEVMKRKSKPQKADKIKFFLYRGLFKWENAVIQLPLIKKSRRVGNNIITITAPRKIQITNAHKMFLTWEEKISSQINEAIQKVSLPDD